MLDHITLHVADLDRSKRFYAAALAPLGYTVMMEFPGVAGLGADGKPDFWLGQGQATHSLHIAFAAEDRAIVDAFHRAATAAGGRDNGAPGLRPQYHHNYYGAFVFDPDGNNIEAVCHQPA
ncbi:MAG TPA: VOC family protein [Candidatus Binatia bacterium]|nr:VOC family protein [Candidatus Binatia bacterium]